MSPRGARVAAISAGAPRPAASPAVGLFRTQGGLPIRNFRIDENDSHLYLPVQMDTGRTALRLSLAALLIATATATATAAGPADTGFRLVLKEHRFTPAELVVPAGRKLRLVVENQDPTPEEFESYALNREKIVPGHGQVVVFVGPLKPGRYEFFGEFNPASARGWLVAEP